MFPNWAKYILFLLVYMLSGLVLFIIVGSLLSGADLFPLNAAIENTVTHFRTPLLTNLMVVVTYVGSPFILFLTSCLLSVVLTLKGKHFDALIFIISMSIAVSSFILLKEVFQISRPSSDLLDLNSWSFPSGHASVATAFFFVLAHSFLGQLKNNWSRLFLILGSIFGAALVSFSRLYLGVHWTLDIMAGIAVGLISVSFTVLIFSLFSREKIWEPRKRRF